MLQKLQKGFCDAKKDTDVPTHIVQGGNNREACFFCDDVLKELLAEGLKRYGGAHCLAKVWGKNDVLVVPMEFICGQEIHRNKELFLS